MIIFSKTKQNMNSLSHYANEIKAFIYSIFIFLDIDIDIVQILMYLMILDTVLGSTKAVVLDKGFSFKILLKGFLSKIAILIIPFTIALVAKGLEYDFKWAVIVVMDILLVSEGISAIENIISIKTKKEIKKFDAITKLLKALRFGLVSIFGKMIGKIETTKEDEDE